MRGLPIGDRVWAGRVAALAAGMLLPLAFAPFDLFPLAFLVPAFLFLLWRESAPRAALWQGFWFGLGLFGVGVSWVYVAIHVYGQTAAPLAAALTALFVAALAVYPALLGYCSARWGRGGAGGLLLVMPALWTLFEWFRGRFLTGFPWLNLGYSQVDLPLGGLAPVLGVYGVSWACAVTAGALAWLWVAGRRAWVPVVPLLALLWGGGWFLGNVDWTHPLGAPLRVSLVQGNLPQITKWDPEKIQERLDRYAQLTLPRLGVSDLVVWPENAITVFYRELKDGYFAWLQGEAKASGTDLLLGVPVLDGDGQRYYTTMMSLGRHHDFYRKHHLVPFGEFVPLEGVLRGLIHFFDLPMTGFSPGPSRQPPLAVGGRRAAVTICYEDAFGEELLHALPEASLLINGSNNAWYGNSLAPHQHLEISRMRARETGRPLLRATINGISALVDHRGHLLAEAPQFQTYVLDGEVQPMAGATPYVRWGNAAVLSLLLCALFIPAAVGLLRRRRGRWG